MTRWLLSWKTQATLALLGAIYTVVGVLSDPFNWSAVVTGLLVAGGSTWLAVDLYRAHSPDREH